MRRASSRPIAALPRVPSSQRRPAQLRSSQAEVRAAAAWVVERTLASLAPVDSFLGGALGRYDERDQGFLRELVFGTLRWLRRLDGVIAAASNRRLADVEPALLSTLRVAAYQLLFLDRVPAHAAVNEAVEQAAALTHRGGASFVNAVLRRIARSPTLAEWPVTETEPVRRLAIELSHPDFLVRRWVDRFGMAATRELLEANNRPKPMQLLAFRDRGGRELLAEDLIDEGIEVEPSSLSPFGLLVRAGNPLSSQAFRRGDLYVQDEASQAAAWLPPPQPGERVLDAAAAPGGKTLALLAREPSVRVVAADVGLSRLGLLSANLRRLRRAVPCLLADAGRPALGQPFDRVIADLPCTGTGTLRKHPELKWRVSESELGRLAAQGLRMLKGLAPLVRPGGLLVVSSCSLEDDENEAVVERFLAAVSGFERLDLGTAADLPSQRWVVAEGLWRALPEGDHDGFTVQVLKRQS